MRLATWNLDSSRASARTAERQRHHVERVGADVWVLTEASASSTPAGHAAVPSAVVPGGTQHFAVLTAQAVRPLAVAEVPTAAAGVATVGGQDWLVVGVCMPWRRDAPPLPTGAAPAAATGPEQWRAVLGHLDAALTRLGSENPGLPVVLAGDLNQTLEGHVVGSRLGRVLLEGLLRRHALTAYTAASPSARAGCSAVDHVCGTPTTAAVDTWSSVDADAGLVLTDHRGYVVDVRAT